MTHLLVFGCEVLVTPVDHDGDLVSVVAGTDLLVRQTLDVLSTGELTRPRLLLSERDSYPHHLPSVRTDRTNVPPSLPRTITAITVPAMVPVYTGNDLFEIRSLSEVIRGPGVGLPPLVFLGGLVVTGDDVFL